MRQVRDEAIHLTTNGRGLRLRPAMMQAVWFTVVGAMLYLLADRLLEAAERYAGRRFEQRSLVFFALLLGMALASFALIRRLTTG
jgi:hypothetical protein